MVLCSFCGKDIPAGTGKLHVLKDGKMFRFCSNKCQKHQLLLKHKSRTTRWTNEFHQIKKGVKQ